MRWAPPARARSRIWPTNGTRISPTADAPRAEIAAAQATAPTALVVRRGGAGGACVLPLPARAGDGGARPGSPAAGDGFVAREANAGRAASDTSAGSEDLHARARRVARRRPRACFDLARLRGWRFYPPRQTEEPPITCKD